MIADKLLDACMIASYIYMHVDCVKQKEWN